MSLYLAGVVGRVAPALAEVHSCAVPGDVESTVADYETSGDATFRLVALAGRMPELVQVVEGGRRAHRAWIEHASGPQLKGPRGKRRERVIVLLAASLDVLMWRLLRRDQGLGRDQTGDHLSAPFDGTLASATASRSS
jgi:hypothetical protein